MREKYLRELYNEPNLIGVETYDLEIMLGKGWESMLGQLKPYFNDPVARTLQTRLHNNCQLGHPERPCSAFYMILDDNLVVLCGKINEQGSAKLHSHIRASDEYSKIFPRAKSIFSGHTGIVEIPGIPNPIKVALFDSVTGADKVTNKYKEFPAIATMTVNGIVPITSDGYVVNLVL